jgi:hypothetical protein
VDAAPAGRQGAGLVNDPRCVPAALAPGRGRARALARQLTSWGISVFVDFDDPQLSQLPDGYLADRLMTKLRLCRLLVWRQTSESRRVVRKLAITEEKQRG